ncbi:hypothetical protein CRG98_036312 [Punica granatum]|uniref:Uncharacterized protein n=1 Tax=Punica granatum TaxID=22663 RepID=A0A2I0IH46_PUNGR|nr:hypothetical protein CRG98_036312 [Punica granatum]
MSLGQQLLNLPPQLLMLPMTHLVMGSIWQRRSWLQVNLVLNITQGCHYFLVNDLLTIKYRIFGFLHILFFVFLRVNEECLFASGLSALGLPVTNFATSKAFHPTTRWSN